MTAAFPLLPFSVARRLVQPRQPRLRGRLDSVKGKTVLVTGGAGGLGKLFATRAVQEAAAAVVIWDVDEKLLATTASELRARGGNVSAQVRLRARRSCARCCARAPRHRSSLRSLLLVLHCCICRTCAGAQHCRVRLTRTSGGVPRAGRRRLEARRNPASG